MKYLFLLLLPLSFAWQSAYATCTVPKPTGLHSTAITSCSVTMAWNASPGAAYYVFSYQKKGSTTPTTVNVGTATSYEATGLVAKKEYSFKVEAFCSDGTTKGWQRSAYRRDQYPPTIRSW